MHNTLIAASNLKVNPTKSFLWNSITLKDSLWDFFVPELTLISSNKCIYAGSSSLSSIFSISCYWLPAVDDVAQEILTEWGWISSLLAK